MGFVKRAQEERELEEIRSLKQRDQEVRVHEQAHSASGGVHAGSASFSYETGPDGVLYAVGGEVSVDVSKVSDDPQATLDKMEKNTPIVKRKTTKINIVIKGKLKIEEKQVITT